MALNPTLKKATASFLIVSCINLTASAALMPVKQQFHPASEFSTSQPQEAALNQVSLPVNNNSNTHASKPYYVSLSNITKAEAKQDEEKKRKKKAVIWIFAGAAVVVAIILLGGGKKSTAPAGAAPPKV